MRHSRSEDLLGAISRSPSPCVDLPTTASEDDLIAASALRDSSIYDETVGSAGIAGPSRRILSSSSRTVGVPVDPEDSIRDIVTENDLYRSVRNNSFKGEKVLEGQNTNILIFFKQNVICIQHDF